MLKIMAEGAVKSENHKLNPSILRAYDIRGIVGQTLFPEDAYYIGKAFASMVADEIGGHKIVVCFDGRISSPSLAGSLIDGLQSSGCEVIDIDLGPTPMLYYAAHKLNADGAVMVTGSHNPKEYNGFKFMIGKSSLSGEEIQEIGKICAAGDFDFEQGSERELDIKKDYIEELLDIYQGRHKLKIAWDPGNGATGDIVKELCNQLPGEHILINEKIDGNFPNHHPDPTVESNLEQLIEIVKNNQCDLGIAFDGDGDRIGAVDNKGRMIAGDQLLTIFAEAVLAKNPHAPIIADIKASKLFFDTVRDKGGNPIIWKSGHSLIKAEMQERGAWLAGEMSGHIFFADEYYGFDDGIYAAIRLINIVSNSTKSLAEIIDAYPAMHNTPEFRIECDDSKKFHVIKNIEARLRKQGRDFHDIDGVRVEKPNGWWLVRASNTQAAISARCEAVSAADLETIKAEMEAELEAEGVKLVV